MAGVLGNLFPGLRLRRNVAPGGHNQQQPPANQQPNQQPMANQGAARPQQPQANANANAEQQFANIRDRLFHTIFVRLSLGYARAFSARSRRLIEFCSLVIALCSLVLLTYIHIAFSHLPTHCLDHVRDWPRDGILRVEIIRNPGADYTLAKSYEKEERLKLRGDPDSLILASLEEMLSGATTPKTVEQPSEDSQDTEASESGLGDEERPSDAIGGAGDSGEAMNATTNSASTGSMVDPSDNMDADPLVIDPDQEKEPVASDTPLEPPPPDDIVSSSQSSSSDDGQLSVHAPGDPDGGLTSAPLSTDSNATDEMSSTIAGDSAAAGEHEAPLANAPSGLQRLFRTVWPDDDYIVEFSLEYGLLRLLPATRRRLGVPTRIVLLDPDHDACFGDVLSRQILAKLIGYDDILLSSVKELSEAQDNRGFLRNVVTGEFYRFVSNWPTSTSVVNALFIMICFTLTVSMLLRYSHQQIFIFIVDLLQMLEANTVAHFPAAPLLTVILALVGMEAVMSEFFNDTTTAFYVILTVWMVDQYDAVCCHTAISRKHFLRFFFLYHFCFYAYHYRFNGQYSGLALATSWLFIQHAMLYFFHHYELPVILRNARIQQLVTDAIRRDNLRRAGVPAPPDAPAPTPEQVLLAMMDAPTPPPAAARAAQLSEPAPVVQAGETPAGPAAGLSVAAPVVQRQAGEAADTEPPPATPSPAPASQPTAAGDGATVVSSDTASTDSSAVQAANSCVAAAAGSENDGTV